MGFLSNLFGGLTSGLGKLASGAMNMFNSGGGGNSAAPMSIGGGRSTYGTNNIPTGMGNNKMPNMGGNMMDIFKSPITQGLGIMGAGQLFGGKPKVPNFNTPDVQALRSFQANPPALPQNMQDEIGKNLDIQNESELRNLRNVYKNARPGTDYTTDSAYQRDEANLSRNQASNRANALMGPTLQYQQTEQKNLEDMAQLSIAQIMAETGMQAEEAQQLKEMFGNVGGMFLQKGLGLNQFKV